jgi:hypothetical protein
MKKTPQKAKSKRPKAKMAIGRAEEQLSEEGSRQ